jgi:hypothetical protein
MPNRFRAHFDGRVLVPDEPVSLPVNQAIELEVIAMHGANGEPPANVAERLAALRALAGSIHRPPIPLEALRRENLYDERT